MSRISGLWPTGRLRVVVIALALLGVVASCGGGGGGDGPAVTQVIVLTIAEEEYNGDIFQATALPPDRAGIGSLGAPLDIDFWSFEATAGQIIGIEVCALRFDLQGWSEAKAVPFVQLWGPPNGSVLEIEQSADYWPFTSFQETEPVGNPGVFSGVPHVQDLDIACYRIPVTGTYFVRLESLSPAGGGNYAVRVIDYGISPLDVQESLEGNVPGFNENVGTAEFIEPGVISAYLDAGENDFYEFTLVQPSIVRFEVKGHRNGVTDGVALMDPRLSIWNGGSLLADNDDSFNFDPMVEFQFLNPGTYQVLVDNFFISGSGPYVLFFDVRPGGDPTRDSEPNDIPGNAVTIPYGTTVNGMLGAADDDWYKFTAEYGDMIRITEFSGLWGNTDTGGTVLVNLLEPDAATFVNSSFDTPYRRTIIQADGTFFIQVLNVAGSAAYSFRLDLIKRGFDEAEPNNVSANATNLGFSPTNTGAGALDLVGDVDWWSFAAETNQLVCVSAFAAGSTPDGNSLLGAHRYDTHGSSLEPELEIPAKGQAIPDVQNFLTPEAAGPPYFLFTPKGTIETLPTMQSYFVAPATSDGYRVRIKEFNDINNSSVYYLIQTR